MSVFITFFSQIVPLLQSILLVAALIGGTFVVRNTRKNGIVQIQSDTILAMQQQIDALKEQNAQQQKELDHQEFELTAMREALKEEGIYITIDGERVTIKDAREPGTTRHIVKKPVRKMIPSKENE